MGKIAPPVEVRINSGEAVVTLNQALAAQRAVVEAVRGFAGTLKAIDPEKKPRVCSQCGAPLVGDTCEYCRTEYK